MKKSGFLGGKIRSPLLYLFYTSFIPLLGTKSPLLSQGFSEFLNYVLSVYQLRFVCLSTTFCLFINYVLSVY